MNPTLQDRFRGALMGGLLGPIYCFQRQSKRKSLAAASNPGDAERLMQHWNTLRGAGEALLQPALGKANHERDEVWPELRLLRALPSSLLGWDGALSDAALAQSLRKADVLSGDVAGFTSLLQDVGQCLEHAPHQWDVTLACWLNGQVLTQDDLDADTAEPLSRQSLGDSTAMERVCLGAQLMALLWGANKGAQAIPWRAKADLGAIYPELLQLSDRLYGAWAGQADFEKLGVSCEGSLPMATSII